MKQDKGKENMIQRRRGEDLQEKEEAKGKGRKNKEEKGTEGKREEQTERKDRENEG